MRIIPTINASSVSHDGTIYEPDEQGVFDVPEHVGAELCRFGHWEPEHIATANADRAAAQAAVDPQAMHEAIVELDARISALEEAARGQAAPKRAKS